MQCNPSHFPHYNRTVTLRTYINFYPWQANPCPILQSFSLLPRIITEKNMKICFHTCEFRVTILRRLSYYWLVDIHDDKWNLYYDNFKMISKSIWSQHSAQNKDKVVVHWLIRLPVMRPYLLYGLSLSLFHCVWLLRSKLTSGPWYTVTSFTTQSLCANAYIHLK